MLRVIVRMIATVIVGVLMLVSLAIAPAMAGQVEPADREVNGAPRISYIEGSARTGYWVEWNDGSAYSWPSKRVALRACNKADWPRQCVKRTHSTYRHLARNDRRLNG